MSGAHHRVLSLWKTIERIFDSYSIFRWQQGRSARDVTTAGIYHGSYFDQIYPHRVHLYLEEIIRWIWGHLGLFSAEVDDRAFDV